MRSADLSIRWAQSTTYSVLVVSIVTNRVTVNRACAIVDHQYQLSALRTVDAVDMGHRYTAQ